MRFLLLLLVLLMHSAFAEGVWKWKDENNVVHYSDQPGPGAVRIDLHAQTFSSQAATTPPSTSPTNKPSSAASAYRSLEIWKPEPEETFPNTGGQVDVRLRLDPALAPSDTLALYLDGKRVEEADNALDFTLTEVPRGAHSLVATVTSGATGRVAIQSAPVNFYVQQASVARPPVGPSLKNTPRPRG